MNKELIEVLTKVYGFTNQLKVDLTFNSKKEAFETVNKLVDYLLSVDTGEVNTLELPEKTIEK